MATDGAPWHRMRWRTEPGVDWPLGHLFARRAEQPASSRDAVVIDGSTLTVHMPWTLLQFADPSTRTVIDDDRATPSVVETTVSDGIGVAVVARGEVLRTRRLGWTPWNRVPDGIVERVKPAMQMLADQYAALPDPAP